MEIASNKGRTQLLRSIFLFILLLVVSSVSDAKIHYLDPVNGSSSGDGTLANPYGSLESVFAGGLIESRIWTVPYDESTSVLEDQNLGAPIKPGDTLRLLDGYHGSITVRGYYNTDYITVEAVNKHKAQLRNIITLAASKWIFKDLAISPSFDPSYDPLAPRPSHPHLTNLLQNIVYLQSHAYQGPSNDIKVIGNHIFSVEDASGWSASDWVQRASSGIFDRMDHTSELSDNIITNITYGIRVTTDGALVKNNHITNFSIDGFNGNGDNAIYEYNFVANGFDVDEFHKDAFQCFTGPDNPTIDNVIIRGNQFINDVDHPNPSLKSNFQGIGCFYGMLNNFLIDNNLIVVDDPHGISLYGADRAVISNNTVVDADPQTPTTPAIRIVPRQQDGLHGDNNLVYDNIGLMGNTFSEFPGANTDYINNIFPITSFWLTAFQGYNIDINTPNFLYDDLFINSANGNYRLKTNSPAVDAGSATLAVPMIDIEKQVRDIQSDLGAYEYRNSQ